MSIDFFLTSEHNTENSNSKDSVKIAEEEKETSELGKEVKLNYVLDELKNMKVNKANTKKDMELKKIEIDELNFRYELDSALFLVAKEELVKMKPGDKFVDKDVGIQMELDSLGKQMDKKENNPVTVLKWKVTETTMNWESQVAMNLYHTNQGVHFQGGSTNGNVTSCSLASTFFETFCQELKEKRGVRIEGIRNTLLKMDLRKK